MEEQVRGVKALYVLGVDGGGTKTEAVLADGDGCVIGRGRSGGSNPNFVGKAAAFQAIRQAVEQARGGVEWERISRIAMCVPGLEKHAAEWLATIDEPVRPKVDFHNDVMSTFYGAVCAEAGVVVLAGTGSFALGINGSGCRKVVGGWGPVVGDDGSGQQIAVQTLRAVTKHADGLGPATGLTEKVLGYYGIRTVNELKAVVALDNVSRIVPLTADAAREGDLVAKAIMDGAGAGLAEMAVRVIRDLDMDDSRYAIALAGGLSKLGKLLLEPLQARLSKDCSRIRAAEARFSPVTGALLLAYRTSGIEWSEDLMKRIEVTLH